MGRILFVACAGLIAVQAIAEPAPRASKARKESKHRPAAAPDVEVRVAISGQEIDAALLRAVDAANAGKLVAAEAAYGEVLAAQPAHGEALRGMAAIALRRGQPALAAEHYRRAADSDPGDILALAGLLGLRGQADPLGAQGHLKNLIAAQPGHPALLFALGSAYAAGERWSEAARAFEAAHRADPAHPDYLFNLAVSLDRLHRPEQAALRYEQALAAAKRHPASFEGALAEARLRDLRP